LEVELANGESDLSTIKKQITNFGEELQKLKQIEEKLVKENSEM
jgi:hypothetical protein